MANSRSKYHQDYVKKNLKRVPLEVPHDKYDQIKEHAVKHNESVNGFIKRAIDETMKNDNEKPD